MQNKMGSVGETADGVAYPSPPPSPPEFVKKAKDLQALRDAVVDAANVSGGLWVSYLFVFFYLAIAAGGVGHRDLFLENPVKLPFLNVDLPLVGFFVLGPLLFVIVHSYILLHFTFLADKVGAFHAELKKQIEESDADTGERLRRQLPSNIFVQFLAGPRETRNGATGFLLRLIALVSLVIGPVLLLVFFQLQFLPYHSEWISWWQRLMVVADLVLLWFLWPSVARGAASSLEWRDFCRVSIWACVLVSVLPVLLVFTIATYPGEWLDEVLPRLPIVPISWAPHTLLVGGAVNGITQRPSSPGSNRLVLPGIDLTDHIKLDTANKATAQPTMVSLRGRHLEGAVLIGAHLRKADFTGAYLKGAQMDEADLREATLTCADTAKNEKVIGEPGKEQCADLRGASLLHAQLQGANLSRAKLQGADLEYAQIQGANLSKAQLQGTDLVTAQLQGANLAAARLQGTALIDTGLQGANLSHAELQGALLANAQLQGASLYGAQLQGAELGAAQLQAASLEHVFVWRAETPNTAAKGAYIFDLETAPKYEGLDCPSQAVCNWTAETFSKLKQRIETDVPQKYGAREQALARIEELDPNPDQSKSLMPLLGGRAWAWEQLAQSLPPKDYEKNLAAMLKEIGCDEDSAPFVIRGFLHTRFDGRFTTDKAQARAVAQAFLNEAQCPGARGLSEEDKELLRQISVSSSTAEP